MHLERAGWRIGRENFRIVLDVTALRFAIEYSSINWNSSLLKPRRVYLVEGNGVKGQHEADIHVPPCGLSFRHA